MADGGVFRLYGATFSLYTGKVRAYLRYRNIPFTEERITGRIIKRIGYFMVPVLETPEGELVQDSTEIIDYLEERFAASGPSIYPEDPVQRLVALLVEVYADEWLRIPAMHYRWKYNRDYVIREFGRIAAPGAPEQEQILAGEQASAGFSGSLPGLGITPDTWAAIESWYEELLGQLHAHLENREYMFGSRPSIGDYGLMAPLYAHLYRDPWSGQQMRRLAPNLVRWIDMMNTPWANGGTYEPDLAPTMIPVLKRIFADCVPAMVDTCRQVSRWHEEHPGEAIPRSIGRHGFSIGGIPGQRLITPFSQWMFQRPLDYYHSLTGPAKARADHLLTETGGKDLMQEPVQAKDRLSRQNYQLIFIGDTSRNP